jgi:hypothetical protein
MYATGGTHTTNAGVAAATTATAVSIVRKASAKLDSDVGIVMSSVSQSPANREMILPLDVICCITYHVYSITYQQGDVP